MAKINSKALCYNQKFGHNFPYPGANCLQCGINQNELSGQVTKIKNEIKKLNERAKKPERGIHSELHALAKEVSEYAGEPKKFTMYLGIIKNIGLKKAYRIFSEIKQSASWRDIKTPGKLFVYKSTYKKYGNNKRTKSGSSSKTRASKKNNS